MKIICNNGEGREPNPYEKILFRDDTRYSFEQLIIQNEHWADFEVSVKWLPVYDQSGKLFTGSGEVEAELVEQFLSPVVGWFDKNNGDWTNYVRAKRQIYRISDHIEPTDQEKEEIKTSEKLEPGESVDEAELRLFAEFEDQHLQDMKECILNKELYFSGIENQVAYRFKKFKERGLTITQSQTNLIEKEKVIELLEAEMSKSQYLHDINYLLTKIKEL